MTLIRALLVDMDGTMSLNNTGRPWYGDGYEKRLHEDTPNRTVIDVLDALTYKGGFVDHVVFVSGRAEVGRAATTTWLMDHTFYDPDGDDVDLFMRADEDFRSDVEVKTEIYNQNIRDVYDVRLALDDKPELIALWRSLGIPAWQVNEYR